MIIDYDDKTGLITAAPENGENFAYLQGKTKFSFCPKINKGSYKLPFISLPILKKSSGDCGYSFRMTDRMKKFYSDFKRRRELLSFLKEKNYSDIFEDERFSEIVPEINSIIDFIKSQENLIRSNLKNFGGFYGNQIDSIVYGIIGRRVVIANDIGTGKTLVSIVIAKYFMDVLGMGKTLVMLPASLAKNFYEDYNKFYGDGKMVLVKDETKEKRNVLYGTVETCDRVQFLITNYEKCRVDYEALSRLKFDVVIVDEFHKMKNFKEAEMSKNFFNLVSNVWKPKCAFPMSGTPIENRIFDIYPMFKLIDGGHILGGEKFFEENFILSETRTFRVRTKYGKIFDVVKKTPVGFKNHKFVKSLIAPYVIRKKLDLPAGLYRKDVLIEPTKELMERYGEILSEEEGSARYHAVRQLLCSRPDINPKFEELENIVSQTSSKVLIFSFYKISVREIKDYLESKGYKCLTCMGGDGTDPLDVVRQFKEDPDCKCLITTDKINYGHNIQFAKIIIEWEKPIKPTTSMQRIGRCYRSGQTDDVHAYSFVVRNTVEDIIMQQLEAKKDVIDKVIESLSDESSDTTLDDITKSIENAVKRSLNKILFNLI